MCAVPIRKFGARHLIHLFREEVTGNVQQRPIGK